MMTRTCKRGGRANTEQPGGPLIKLEHLAEWFKEDKQ